MQFLLHIAQLILKIAYRRPFRSLSDQQILSFFLYMFQPRLYFD